MMEKNLKLPTLNLLQIVAITLLAWPISARNASAFSLGANQTIDLRGNNLFSDSFDSSNPLYSINGLYPFGYIDRTKANGDLCAGTGIIDSLGIGNVMIKGSVRTGPGITNINIGSTGTVGDRPWVEGGNLGIQPGHSSTDFNALFPVITIPRGPWLPIVQTSYSTNLWGTNIVYYKYVISSGNANWEINGSVTGGILFAAPSNSVVKLWITGSVNLGSNDTFTILPTGQQVRIYTSGTNFFLGGNSGIDNESGFAARLCLYGLPACTNLNFSGNGNFCGAVYAPQAGLVFGGGGNNNYDFIGSTVGRTVTMNGHFNFHFDEDLDRHPVFPPRILAQPQSQVALAGSNAAFTVTTQWTTGVQWLFFGTNIIGATNNTLALTNVSPVDAGSYSVVLSNSIFSTTSTVATLTVYTTPAGALSLPLMSTNGLQFNVTGVPGFQYAVEASTNLMDWLPLATNVVPFDFVDPGPANYNERYYRSIWLP